MNIFMIAGLAVIIWLFWMWMASLYIPTKRKRLWDDEDVGFEEKPKREEKPKHEEVTGWTTRWASGWSTCWNGGNPNESKLTELEREYIESVFDQKSLDRIDRLNTEIMQAIQAMKDLSTEYEIHPLSELMEAPVPLSAENPPSHTSMTK